MCKDSDTLKTEEDGSWCPEDCIGHCCLACDGEKCELPTCPIGKTKEQCNCSDDGK